MKARMGPLTRKALIEAELDETLLNGILEGRLEWEIASAFPIGISASEEAAREAARDIALRKDFCLVVYRTRATQEKECPWDLSKWSRRLYEALIPNSLGQRIARTRRYEDALAARGGAGSPLFEGGSLDDWTAVQNEPSWDALAFEFRRAAEAVAATHTVESPAPALVLLALCRHHIELALKTVIMSGDRLVGNPLNLPTRHPLRPLWDRAEPLMRASWAEGWNKADVTATRLLVLELDKVDESGMATRYPVDTTNTPFVRPASLLNFSVTGFMKAFVAASDFLGTAALWIEVGLRSKEKERTLADDDD